MGTSTTTDDSVSDKFQSALGDLQLQQRAGTEQIEAAQVSMLSLLQHETLRIETRLGSQHPRTLQLKSRLQSSLQTITTLQVERQIASIQVPEVTENGALVHGRIVDEDGLGIDSLLVSLVDQSGAPTHDSAEPITAASGYFAIPIDPAAVDRFSKQQQKGAFLAVFTPRRRLVHQEPKPLALSPGAKLFVEVQLTRSDLTTVPSPPSTTVAVPNLVGLVENEGLAALKKAELNAGQRTTKVAPDQVGRVLDQNPAAGSSVGQGTSVSLVIGVQSQTVKVPSVIGRSLKDAKEEITRSGLSLGRISGPLSDDSIVQDQDPKPDTEIEAGTLVNLVVAQPDQDVIRTLVERMATDETFAEIGASVGKIEKRLRKNGINTKEQLASLLEMPDQDLKTIYGLPNLNAASAFKRVLGRALRPG